MVLCSPNGIQTCANNVIWECQNGQWVGIANAQCAGFKVEMTLRNDVFDKLFNDFGARGVFINELLGFVSTAYPSGDVTLATFPSILEFDASRKKMFINFSTPDNLAQLAISKLDLLSQLVGIALVIIGAVILITATVLTLPILIAGVGLVALGGIIVILTGEQEVRLSEASLRDSIINNPNISPEDKATIIDLLNQGGYKGGFIGDITNLVIVAGAIGGGLLLGNALIKSGFFKKT